MLSLINVTKRFGYRTVLNRACLEIKQGEAVGLLGKNGSGKSTLLRIVSRILSYDFGSILWNGKPLMSSKLDSRRFLLYLGHEPGLYPPLSALENLQLVANIYGEDSSRKRIEKHLEAVGVDYSTRVAIPAETGTMVIEVWSVDGGSNKFASYPIFY